VDLCLSLFTTFDPPNSHLPDFADVDILEEADKSDEGAEKFNLEWMVKVMYTIKPSQQ